MKYQVKNPQPNARRVDPRCHLVSVVSRPVVFFSARWQLADASQTDFMQDETPPHTARNTQQWCQENLPGFRGRGVEPGNSLDLILIENLWLILEEKVNKAASAAAVMSWWSGWRECGTTSSRVCRRTSGTRMPQRMNDSIAKDDPTGK